MKPELQHSNSSKRAWWALKDFHDRAKDDKAKADRQPIGIRHDR